MNKQRPIVLIIDPALETPCIEAMNCISEILGELKESPQCCFSHCEYISPFLSKLKLRDFIQNKNIGAVVCLGSVANITDQLPYVNDLIFDLETYIFKNNIPFFGICFSHQVLADMHGFKVNFLKKRHTVPKRKYHLFRTFQILHPKLSLLATKFEYKDYYSDSCIDLNFKYVIKVTKNWGKEQWNILSTDRDWILTTVENKVKLHIKNNTFKNITSHARHEQEVWEEKSSATDVTLGATSPLCSFEALVHNTKPFFSLQTHPETKHESKGGYLLLKNFIYMSSIILSSQ